MLRILRGNSVSDLAAGLERHQAAPEAGTVSAEALELLRSNGRRRTAGFPQLASKAVGGDAVTAASFAVLADQLLAAVDS